MSPPDRAGREAILRGPHPLGAARRRRRPRRDRRLDARAWSAPTWPTSPTRRRCWPPRATTPRSPTPGLHRRAGADRARRRAQGDDLRGRPPPHRLPRGRPRDHGHAHPRRRPGAQGLDHPPRHGARASPSRRPTPTASTSTSATCSPRSRSRSAAASAEEVVFGDLTTGAESDIQQLTRIARADGRPLGHEPRDRADRGAARRRPGPAAARRLRDLGATQRLVDEEVRRIVETAHEEATVALSSHRDNLDSLVSALMEHETLDQAEAYDAAGLPQNVRAQPEEAPPVVSSRRSGRARPGPGRRGTSAGVGRAGATAGGGPRSRPRARARSRSTPRRRAASRGRPPPHRAYRGRGIRRRHSHARRPSRPAAAPGSR